MRTPKTRGSTRRPKASGTIKDHEAGILPNRFQLQTACADTLKARAAAEGPPSSEMICSTELSMEPEYTRIIYPSSIHEPKIDSAQFQGDHCSMDWGAVKDRLRIAAVAVGANNSKFAESIGLTPQAWFNIYGGPNKLDPGIAAEMRRVHGFSMDWIYCGDLSHLPGPLKDKILEIERGKAPGLKRARK